MNRAVLACLAIGLSAPALAVPLTFGTINGADDLSRDIEVGACPSGAAHGDKTCPLSRRSFGGLAVDNATIALNASGRVRSVDIVLDDADYEVAYRLLAGRYGPATTVVGAPRWSDFDDGASITIAKSASHAIVSLRFPANDAVLAAGGPNPLPMLALFAALAFAIGLVLRHSRQRLRAATSRGSSYPQRMPEPSMRATFERRVRAGEI